MVRQLLDDRIGINTVDEIIDILKISKYWRIKKKLKNKIMDRIDQIISLSGIIDSDLVRQLDRV